MKTKNTSVSAPPNNSFLRVIGEIRKGDLVGEASTKLANLVKEVRATGKGGELVVKLKVTPTGDAMEVVGTAKAKMPERTPKPAHFYDTEEGILQRDNPDQPEMFATVEGGKSEIVAPPLAAVVNQ